MFFERVWFVSSSSCGYGVPCPKKTPVQFMEDEVPGLWQTKIRNVDTKWNQTKSGDLGPAAQFYATIPKGVIGLGAGAYGETAPGDWTRDSRVP